MSYQRFQTAVDARNDARDRGVIHSEITAIESAIISSVDAGNLETTVSGTTFTSDPLYYLAYQGAISDPTRADRIQVVNQYFVNRGYGVRILETTLSVPVANSNTSANVTSFSWNINW